MFLVVNIPLRIEVKIVKGNDRHLTLTLMNALYKIIFTEIPTGTKVLKNRQKRIFQRKATRHFV